jgi:uncharacterized protein (UPF0297 family)
MRYFAIGAIVGYAIVGVWAYAAVHDASNTVRARDGTVFTDGLLKREWRVKNPAHTD